MDDQFIESRKAVARAREAMRVGDHAEARIWAERAAQLTPTIEDPWLILAAAANPADSVAYLQKALDINPDSPRARRGMEWARERSAASPPPKSAPSAASLAGLRKFPLEAMDPQPSPGRGRRTTPTLPALIFILGCLLVACAAGAIGATQPSLFASFPIIGRPQTGPAGPAKSWAPVEIAKPTQTLRPLAVVQPTLTATLPALLTDTPAPPIVVVPVIVNEDPVIVPDLSGSNDVPQAQSAQIVLPTPEDIPTLDPGPSPTPGTLYAEIVADTPTSEYVAPTSAAFDPAPVPSGGYGDRWIDVDLSQQRVYAYEGDTVVNSFVVSTGTWQTPTVTGRFSVWIKLRSTTMAGPGYYLTNVPYTMYFYKGYGLHGTYWHNNFGTPMSHGCVNLTISDAEWLYNFSSVGTVVNVHY